MARGSLSETLEHLNTALDENYLSGNQYNALRELIAETWKQLNGCIACLKKCAGRGATS